MSSPDTDVLVVGAGPTGLTAALVLTAAGVGVRIVDRTEGPVQESRALVVQARTLELWHKLGLAERAVEDGQPMRGLRMIVDGRPLRGGDLLADVVAAGSGLTPYPFVLVYEQDRVERLLVDALAERGVHVERRTEALGLEQGSDGVDVTLTSGRVRARYVVGADGAHSLVRTAAGIRFEGAGYDGGYFLTDVAVDGPVAHDALTVSFTRDGRFVLLVPMRDRPSEGGRSRFRVFGSLPASTSEADQVTLEQAQAQVDAVTGLRTRLHDPRWASVYRLSHRMVDRFRADRVLLAGDAAHIHSPVGGQGMNTGIQDAYDAAWMLAAVVRGEAGPRLLDAYDRERRPFARSLLGGTDRAFTIVTRDTARLRLARTVGAALVPYVVRLPGLPRRGFATIGQLAISYRSSPAVGGDRSRRAAPGDRAPYARLASGASVFDLLTGPEHHLLVAGDPAPLLDALRGFAVRVRPHVLRLADEEVRLAYGMGAPTAVLVRPDGYIGWRGSPDDAAGLAAHLADAGYLAATAAMSGGGSGRQ